MASSDPFLSRPPLKNVLKHQIQEPEVCECERGSTAASEDPEERDKEV